MSDTYRTWAEALNNDRLAADLLELSKDITFYGRMGVDQRAAALREAAWRIKAAASAEQQYRVMYRHFGGQEIEFGQTDELENALKLASKITEGVEWWIDIRDLTPWRRAHEGGVR